jgi:transcriptional regulator with XRE-family HTH domain
MSKQIKQGGQSIMSSPAWGKAVQDARIFSNLSRLELSTSVGLNPSYIFMIETQGYVPRKDKVEKIVKSLNLKEEDSDILTIKAGFSPFGIQDEDFFDLVREYHKKKRKDKKKKEEAKNED